MSEVTRERHKIQMDVNSIGVEFSITEQMQDGRFIKAKATKMTNVDKNDPKQWKHLFSEVEAVVEKQLSKYRIDPIEL